MQIQAKPITIHAKVKPLSIQRKAKPIHKTIIYFLVSLLLKSILTFSAMCVVSAEAIPAAYRERGYYAIGGEWILIIGAGLFVWFGINYMLKEDK